VSQTQFAKALVTVWTATRRPVVQALRLADGQIIYAGDAQVHQAAVIELPVLVPVRAEPVARIVVPFVGEADRDAVVGECP